MCHPPHIKRFRHAVSSNQKYFVSNSIITVGGQDRLERNQYAALGGKEQQTQLFLESSYDPRPSILHVAWHCLHWVQPNIHEDFWMNDEV